MHQQTYVLLRVRRREDLVARVGHDPRQPHAEVHQDRARGDDQHREDRDRRVESHAREFTIAAGLGLGQVAAAVVILLSAMPVAVASHFSVQTRYRAPQDVAGMALISASASIITLPALLILLI